MDHFKKLVRQHKAARDISPADFFRDISVNLDEEFSGNRTLLQNSIMSQDEELFHAILKLAPTDATHPHDINLRDRTNKRWAALHYAVFGSSTGDLGLVQDLITAGADCNAEAGDRRVPLHLAAEMGATNVVEALVKGGADVNRKCEAGGVLHIALISDKPETFDFCLSLPGVDLLLTDEDGNTILHLAAKGNNFSEIEKTIGKLRPLGEDMLKKAINAKNRAGNTPLHESVMAGHRSAEDVLRKQPETDLTLQNEKGLTADTIKAEREAALKQQEAEASMAALRKRERTKEKRREEEEEDKIVLGEKEKREEGMWYETREIVKRGPVKLALLALAVVLIGLYAFFYFYIRKGRNN